MKNQFPLKVWAPGARKLEALADGERVPMIQSTTGDGWWETAKVFPSGTRYGFAIDGGEVLPDPRSASQPDGIHGLSCLVDPDAYPWEDVRWVPPRWEDAVIYELHVGTFSSEGTFDSAIGHLDHLVELGITHVELMPVVEFPGERNWGYDGVSIFAPHHAYGGPEALKRLVDACHARGLAAILDVVYNHMGPDGNYLPKFGPYFPSDHMTPWGEGPNLDGVGSGEVRRFFIDNALMWLRDYHFDGLRLDAIDHIVDESAEHFLVSLRKEVDAHGRKSGRDCVLIAESAESDPIYVRPLEDGGYGLNAKWNDEFHHALRTTFTAEKARYYMDFEGLPDLKKALDQGFVYDGKFSVFRGRPHGKSPDGIAPTGLVAYSQTHDQVGNRARGDRLHHRAEVDSIGHKIAAAVTLLSPYVPMIFMGEEWASSSPFLFFTDHQDPELAEAVTRGRRNEFGGDDWDESVPDPQLFETFSRSKLDWRELAGDRHAEIFSWYRKLLQLRKENASSRPTALRQLGTITGSDAKWLSFQCGALRVTASFSDHSHEVEIPRRSSGTETICMQAGPVEDRGPGKFVFSGRAVIITKVQEE